MRTIALALSILGCAAATAQTPNRTPEQVRQDSLAVVRNKKLYPEWYRFNQAPFLLTDSSDILKGWVDQLRLEGNVIVDSIHNNFHTDMPDTTTFTPYSSISIGNRHVKISYLRGLGFMGEGKATMIPYTRELYKSDSVAFRSGTDTSLRGGMMLPDFTNEKDIYYVRITLNGKPVTDWKDVREFPGSFWKGSETYTLRGYNYPPFTNRSYGYAYLICDTDLNINDQLLIEIKEGNKNWMLDRFNITRVAATPRVGAVRVTGEDGRSASISSTEKKTLASAPATRTFR